MTGVGPCAHPRAPYTGDMRFPPVAHIAFTAVLLLIGVAAGEAMAWLGAPLPFMLGSILASAAITMTSQHRFPENYRFPMRFRAFFVGVIGVMIGAQVSPELVALLPALIVAVPAILLFVVLVQAANYLLFRKVGGFSPPTALFSGSPGGLVESLAFGEEAGADLRHLTLMQFLRIILVVTLVPIGISLYEGAPVGSASGVSVARGAVELSDVALSLLLAAIGAAVATRLRFPAAQITGPMLIVGVLSGTGILDLNLPPWLVASAQIVLGTGLGLQFTGITRRMLVGGLGLSLASVSLMLVIGAGLAYGVHALTGLDFEMLFISFAPGGVTEMSLVALSLAANPTFVTLLHLIRIIATVVQLSVLRKLRWV